MDYNTPGARKSLIDAFGISLEFDTKFILLSPSTFSYNCIAFAMGMQDRWVDAENVPWHWWPPVHKGRACNDLIDAFKYLGFDPCGMDDSIDEKFDKVALYAIGHEWTHAAKIIDEGKYHSKFGASYDGAHSNGDVLAKKYGEVYQIMRRPKENAYLTDVRKGSAPGEIHTKVIVTIGTEENYIVLYQGKTYLGLNGHEICWNPATDEISVIS